MRALASWAAFVLAALAWWSFLAPTAIGGQTVYVLVDGHSMEPMLHTGDLAVMRTQAAYGLGDLVLMQVDGGQVIHRLVGGSAATQWETQGDNNSWLDPWTVPNSDIVGAYSYEIAQFGTALTWLRQNPVFFGLLCALLVMPSYLPWHRRRVSPALAAALTNGQPEPRHAGRSGGEFGVLLISAFGALISLVLLGRVLASHLLATPAGAIALVALAWAGGATAFFAYRLYDGRGVAEPTRSVRALSGRLHLVNDLPDAGPETASVTGAVALRSLAERHRLPVLHRIDPITGAHDFLLITQRDGSYAWSPVLPPVPAERVVGGPRAQEVGDVLR